jgi:hypothetical protein
MTEYVQPLPANLGCAHCQAGEPTRARQALILVRSLWETPHLGFALFECRYCRQPYLEHFQEIIDWDGGGDDIWLRWMALTPAEAKALPAKADSPVPDNLVQDLSALMHRRRRLVKDPLGRLTWSETAWDAGDTLPPG